MTTFKNAFRRLPVTLTYFPFEGDAGQEIIQYFCFATNVVSFKNIPLNWRTNCVGEVTRLNCRSVMCLLEF